MKPVADYFTALHASLGAGNRRETIFQDVDDRRFFIATAIERTPVP